MAREEEPSAGSWRKPGEEAVDGQPRVMGTTRKILVKRQREAKIHQTCELEMPL